MWHTQFFKYTPKFSFLATLLVFNRDTFEMTILKVDGLWLFAIGSRKS